MSSVGDGIGKGSFSFKSEETVEAFDAHVERSIPGYHDAQSCISSLARHLVQPNSTVIDVGCATGQSVSRMFEGGWVGPMTTTYILNDTSQSMANKARQRATEAIDAQIGDSKHRPRVLSSYFDGLDEVTANKGECSVVISAFCAQFMPPRDRVPFFKAVHEGLVKNGGLLIFEKLYPRCARIGDYMKQSHHDLKADQGHSREQIAEKDASLRGVMFPVSVTQLLDELSQANLVPTPVWRSLMFAGYLCTRREDE